MIKLRLSPFGYNVRLLESQLFDRISIKFGDKNLGMRNKFPLGMRDKFDFYRPKTLLKEQLLEP